MLVWFLMDQMNVPQKTSGLAVASLIIGIVALCAGPLGVLAVVFGHLALSKIKKNETLEGRGLAVAGLVTGYLGFAFFLFYGGLILLGYQLDRAEQKSAQELFLLEEVETPQFPELGEARQVGENGVSLYVIETTGSGVGQAMSFRIYIPEGTHPDKSLPGVIVAPAGSNLLSGLPVDDSDYHDETLPYAEAGLVVVNYSLDGFVEDDNDDEEITAGYDSFRAAGAGLVNARNALALIREKLPMVDQTRIYSAGHSSAGTLSLLNAAHFPELAGAISYAPAIDLEVHFSELLDTPFIGMTFSSIRGFVKKYSPITHASKVKIPVFLFYARDDSMVSFEEGRNYRFAVEDSGGEVTLQTVSSGGHYRSMINEGIPAAIEWIQQANP